METTHSVSNFGWQHEVTPGKRFIPPTPAELVPVLGPDGAPVINPETNEPVLKPVEGWIPQVEDVELDTIVFFEAKPEIDQVTVFKFALDKEHLASVLRFFIPHLDAEGRLALYEALKETSDIVTPTTKLEVIAGGNREQRRRK